MRLFLIAALIGGTAFAQPRQTVALSKGTPDTAITTLFFYDGSGNLQYICKAPPLQPVFTWTVTASPGTNQGTLTSIVVSANVGTVTTSAAHGLAVGNLVVVAGSTTAALNGAYVIQTVGSTTTFTITTSGVGNATYNTAALTIASTAPRTSAAQWNVERFTYNGTPAIIADQFSTVVLATPPEMASTAYTFICDNRATLAYQ